MSTQHIGKHIELVPNCTLTVGHLIEFLGEFDPAKQVLITLQPWQLELKISALSDIGPAVSIEQENPKDLLPLLAMIPNLAQTDPGAFTQ